MNKKRSFITAIKITGLYCLFSAITFVIIYLTIGTRDINPAFKVISIIIGSSIVVFLVSMREINKKNVQLKFFSEKKESYHELYMNFNKINRELYSTNSKLAESNSRLEELDNLKNVFLANMSHEIRTPLNSILGFSELICHPDILDEKKSKYVRMVKSNSKQLLRIINDILDISKLETNQFKLSKNYFNLNLLLEEASTYVREIIGTSNKQISVKTEKELNDANDLIFSDQAHIAQVLENLLDNAVKFTKSGEIRIGYKLNKSNLLLFYVKDTGQGIKPENHDLIFKRFRQEQEATNRRHNGTGLGLPISKGIVELLGGKMWIQSAPGHGTTVNFTTPIKIRPKEKKKSNSKNAAHFAAKS